MKTFLENFTIVLLFAIALTFLIAVLVMLVTSDRASASGVMNGIGTLAGGVGAILTAAAAISGLATWKKQVTYGKYLDLIWKAQIACQNVSLNVMAYFVASATPKPTAVHVLEAYERTRSTAPSSRKNSERYLVELILACQHLDRLVTKTELVWTIRANRLNYSFISIANEFDARSSDQNSLDSHRISDIHGALESLKNDLENLEAQYR